jgi:peptide/nickel transport system permease protein
MRRYFIRRILLLFPTLFLVSVLVFAVVRVIPGSVIDLMAAEQGMENREEMMELLGLDQPILVQYWDYLYNIFRYGDMGRSLWTGEEITGELMDRLPVSVQLGAMALFLTICLGVPIGVISALKQDTALDYILRSFAIGGLSVPYFWTAVLFLTFSAIWFTWVPPMEFVSLFDDPVASIGQMLAPAMIMSVSMSAGIMRMTRTMMLEVMREDYIRTARAKGLTYWTVVIRHALKNAMIPVITIIGMSVTLLVGGTVVMESIFSIPGMGRYLIAAISFRDYPVIQGVNLVICSTVIVLNLLVDLTYGYLDPRIRYQ